MEYFPVLKIVEDKYQRYDYRTITTTTFSLPNPQLQDHALLTDIHDAARDLAEAYAWPNFPEYHALQLALQAYAESVNSAE